MDMTWHEWRLGWWLLLGVPAAAGAQALPVGDGLEGTYYDGRNFERLVLTRRDATVNFDWHEQRPVAGLAAEQFSVRWLGWLVPPVTGRYVLHISVDDGMRLWLNGRQLLDEWRGQALSYYQLAIDLRAGEPYPLRIDYCQYAYSTRVRLAWELPPAPTAEGASSRRSFWRLAGSKEAGPVVIPTRYLFSHSPVTAPPPPVARAAPSPPPPKPAEPLAAPTVLVRQPSLAATARPRLRSYLPAGAAGASPPAATPKPATAALAVRPDSSRVATAAARLAEGRAVTLRALYFEQGKALLLPAVQASLDTLARALAGRPSLRLEVQGHTDNQGDPAINQHLSKQRADAVCAYLASHGVAASRLRAVGYGGTRPVADNRLPEQRPRNRRVVLKPLSH